MASETGRKGVAWRPVKVASLSEGFQAAYKTYANAYDKAKSLERDLKDGLRVEWESKFPQGIDGKTIAITITGGKLQYAMVPMKERPKKNRVIDEGDDVFLHP
jgi:hypothetical protein